MEAAPAAARHRGAAPRAAVATVAAALMLLTDPRRLAGAAATKAAWARLCGRLVEHAAGARAQAAIVVAIVTCLNAAVETCGCKGRLRPGACG